MTSVFDHPWLSGLFADPDLARLWSAEAQIKKMLAFEAAWTLALGTVGRIDPAQAEEIAKNISNFQPDLEALAKGTSVDGVPIPALVRQLKAAFGPDGVHSGATSQDVIDTAMILTIVETLDVLKERLAALSKALEDLNKQHGAAPLMGRTRMQAATEITVSDRIATWHLPLANHVERIDQLRPRIAHLQVGGASGNRADLGKDEAVILASLEVDLGLPAGKKAWHSMRDGIGEFASVLTLISGTLGKMGQDICLMAQQGIDEIQLSGGGGSSAMPHKQNPVLAELLVTLSRFNATQISGIQQAIIHEQERSGAAWALEWMILPQMVLATGKTLSAGKVLVGQIEKIGKP